MKVSILWDMDGTIADLYAVDNWLEYLRHYDPTPYKQAEAMWDMERLVRTLDALIDNGVEIKVVSWLSKESNKEYDTEVRKAKREWLDRYGFPYQHCHLVPYGTNKAYYRDKDSINILIDDNAEVRNAFMKFDNCYTVNPTTVDIVNYLETLACTLV